MTRSEFEQKAHEMRREMMKVTTAFFDRQQDAEDAAQEALAQLWRYCEHINPERNVKALAVRVAKNCCVSLYRKQRAQTDSLSAPSALQLQSTDASPQEQLEAADATRAMNEALALLKPRERQLFEMRQQEGLSTAQISQLTGIAPPSVTAMVSAARKKLFVELKRRLKP